MFFISGLFPSAFFPFPVSASGPSSNRLLNYQLRLTDPSGIPIADGTKNVKISFYAASTGGTPVATDCGTTGTPVGRKVIFTNGVGSVLIGETTADASHNCTNGSAPNAISATLFDNTSLFIGITVEADAEMTPRKRIVATGYSLNADKLDDMETSKDGGITEGLSATSYIPATDSSGNFTLSKNVTVDTDTFFVDAANNRVGVGTITPAERLEVSAGNLRIDSEVGGSASPSTGFLVFNNQFDSSGNTSANKIVFYDDGSSRYGIGVGAGYLDFFSGDNFRFFIDHIDETTPGTAALTIFNTTGNVAIGTTSAVTRLDLAGNLRATGKTTAVLTGSIDPAASTTVTGVGTLFTTELVVGDRITVTGETRTVTAIASSTSLTVDAAFTDNANDTSPDALYAISTFRTSAPLTAVAINDLGHLVPGADDTYDLGSNTLRWRDAYLGPATLHIGTSTTDEGTISYDTSTNSLQIDTTAGGMVEIAGGSGANGCTIDASGNLNCAGSVSGGGGAGAFVNGGNSFGAAGTLGTNDNFSLAFETNGTTRMTLDTSGHLGIGTSSPSSRLHVNDEALGSGAGAVMLTTGDPITPADLDWSLGGGERAVIMNGGPTGGCCSYPTTILSNSSSSPSAGLYLGGIGWGAKNGGTVDTFTGVKALINATLEGAGGATGGFGAFMTFNTRVNNGALSERMRIANDGNIGIGDTTPTEGRLVVSSVTGTSALIHSSDTTGTVATLGVSSAGSGFGLPVISMFKGGALMGDVIGFDATNFGLVNGINLSSASGKDIGFRINATTEAMRITTTNRVGIGTATPQSKVDIEGGAAIGTTYSGTTAAPTNGLIVEGIVGIGTNNPTLLSPVIKLHVVGGDVGLGRTSVDQSSYMRLGHSDDANFFSYLSNNATWNGTNWIPVSATGWAGNYSLMRNENGKFDFYTGVQSAGVITPGTPALSITNTGNVGIGTTTPQSKLDVEGGAAIGATYSGTTAAPANGLIVEGNVGIGYTVPTQKLAVNGSITMANSGSYNIKNSGGTDASILFFDGSNNLMVNAPSSNILFTVSGAEKARIDTAGNLSVNSVFNVNPLGDVTSNFTLLDGSDLANGAGIAVTTLVLDDTTGFNAGNYVLVNSTYAKIVTVDSGTQLTISPALTWADNAPVVEYHVPEIGGTDTASTLTNRYGRGYFIDGIVAGNGTTYITDNKIESTGTLKINSVSNQPVTFGTGTVTVPGALNVTSTGESAFSGPLKLANVADPDPAGSNGLMYYNTTNNKFRCYQNGAWTDCVAAAGGGMSIGGTVTSATAGSILFANAGPVLAQDNANLFWNDTNNNLGIGTATPVTRLDLAGNLRTTGKANGLITGSINPTASTAVVGIGTLFTTELVVGDQIAVNGEIRTVTAITDNTNLTVDTAFTDTPNDTTIDVQYAIAALRDSGGATKMVMSVTGSVGIGTASPAAGSLTVGDTNRFIIFTASGTAQTAGDIAINGGDLTTSATTFNLVNSTATTVNFAGAATTLNLGPSGAGAASVHLAGGSGDTGCTVANANGNLTCTGNITGAAAGTIGYWTRTGTTLNPATGGDNIATGGTGSITSSGLLTASNGLTLSSGALNLTAGAVNLTGTSGSIALTGFGTTSITSTTATGNIFSLSNAALTLGTLHSISSTSTALSGGVLLGINKTGATGSTAFTGAIQTINYSQTFNGGVALNSTGKVFQATRNITLNNDGQTHTISGALASYSDNGGVIGTGTLTSTADVVQIGQNYVENTGAALNVTTATLFAGLALRVNDDGTFTDSSPFVINNVGNVGIGDAAPDSLLDILSASAADTTLKIANTNAGDFDPVIGFELAEGTHLFTMGIDDSDSDKFKIGTSTVDTDTRLTIDNGGNILIGPSTGIRLQPDNIINTASTNTSIRIAGSQVAGGGGSIEVFGHLAAAPSIFELKGGTLQTDIAAGTSTISGVNALAGATTNQDGGDILIYGGSKATGGGVNGNIVLAHNGTAGIGNVGIGDADPANFKLEIAGHVGPSADDTHDLGSNSFRWRDLYLGPASIHIGTSGNEARITYNTTTNEIEFDANGDGTPDATLDDSGNFSADGTVSGGGGGGGTLQAAYTASTSPELTLDATRGGLTIRDASSPIGANLLEIQNNGGGTTYLGLTSSALNLGVDLLPSTAPTTGSTSRTTTTIAAGIGPVGSGNDVVVASDTYPVIAFYDQSNGDLRVAKCSSTTCSSGVTYTTVDSTDNVGSNPHIALGSDGFPVISYYDVTNQDLKVVKCGNASCSSGNTITTVDSTGSVGAHNDIAYDAGDTFPVISYYDQTNDDLKVVKCGNASCSSGNTITTVDSSGGVGQYNSIAVPASGTPAISYLDGTNTALKVINCGNASCSSGNTTTTVDNTGSMGWYSSIAIGTDGFPVISYIDGTSAHLRVTDCGNASCSSGNTSTSLDTNGYSSGATSIAVPADGQPVIAYYNDDGFSPFLTVGRCSNTTCTSIATAFPPGDGLANAIAISSDGFPFVSYYDSAAGGNLEVTKCGNAGCTSGNTNTTLQSYSNPYGDYLDAVTPADGLPVVSYYDSVNGDLIVTKCGNAGCSSGNTTTTVDSTDTVGQYTSIAIGSDGYPVISYLDQTNSDLKIAKCGNAACSSGNTITTVDSTNNVGSFSSIAVPSDGFPIVSYYDSTSSDLKVLKCGNASCSSGNTATTVESTDVTGLYTSIAIGTDDLAVISYYRATTTNALKVKKCSNAACTSSSFGATVASGASVGTDTSIAVPADGLPVVSYRNNVSGLNVVKCGNSSCSSGNVVSVVDSTTSVGGATSIAVPAGGTPIVAYLNGASSGTVKVAKCGNASCSSSNVTTLVSTSTNSYPVITLPASGGFPMVFYHDSTTSLAPGLKVISCIDGACESATKTSYSGGKNIGSTSNYFTNVYASTFWGKNYRIENFDLAESYRVRDTSIAAGDIVRISGEQGAKEPVIEKTSKAYDKDAVGVISTQPGLLLTQWDASDDSRPVALSGRVPVKVNGEGGAIRPGDAIAASSEAGVGMKAIRPGRIIGYALSAWEGTSGTVEVFVNPGFHEADVFTSDADGTVTLSFPGSTQENSLSTSVARSFTMSNVVSEQDYRLSLKNDEGEEIAYFGSTGDLALKGKIIIGDNGALQPARHIAFDGSTGLMGDRMLTNASGWGAAAHGFADTFVSADELEAGEVVMLDLTDSAKVKRAVRSDGSSAFLAAGVVVDRPGFIAGMEGTGTFPVAMAGRARTRVVGRIAIGDPITLSLAPGVGEKAEEASYILGIALESHDAAGPAYIDMLVKPGWFNGSEVINDETIITPEVIANTMTADLDMAGYAVRRVGLMSGINDLWSIDLEGKLNSKAVVTDKVQTRQLVVEQTGEEQAAGEGVIPLGSTSITVDNPLVKYNSRIFITFFNNAEGGWWISHREDGRFTISLGAPASTDYAFEYLLVGVVDNRPPAAPPAPPEAPSEPPADPPAEEPAPETPPEVVPEREISPEPEPEPQPEPEPEAEPEPEPAPPAPEPLPEPEQEEPTE